MFGKVVLFAFAASLFLCISVSLSAQTASQFPLGNAWVGTAGSGSLGDRDETVVLFFEIPDTTASTLYFAVRNPGNSGNAAQFDEAGSGGTSYWYLIGGTGALSDPNSQLINYTPLSVTPRAGNLLDSFTRTNQNEGWVYFQGVAPSQGEHIGNKYYFKIVLQVDANVG
ncbi:MAG TPA: hypothetical protein VFH83_10865, partial [Spirochaetia bacterium]|nr:hypothetical protein [Spirochaetia bacterium]